MSKLSRRDFLKTAAATSTAAFMGGASAPFMVRYHQLAAAERKRVKIRDVQVMTLQGGRTYTLVKIVSDDGMYGIAEAYGTPGVGGWMDQVLLLDGPYIQDGFIKVTEKPGLGIELNPDVVKAHLAPGEVYWS